MLVCIAMLYSGQGAFAQADSVARTTVSGFVDVYYAYAFSRPPSRERSYTTQPLRHHEFNLNLAMIDLKH
jgi:hypothetical protein